MESDPVSKTTEVLDIIAAVYLGGFFQMARSEATVDQWAEALRHATHVIDCLAVSGYRIVKDMQYDMD